MSGYRRTGRATIRSLKRRECSGSSRLRGAGKHVCQLVNNGTRYVEFRSFDVNPFDPLGFSYEQSLFLHLFLLTMVWTDGKRRYRYRHQKGNRNECADRSGRSV
ncbi:MAG: hypothetical protein U5K84_00225 [Alkalibacterium sp.]|nr:hypothetical protein [Alkalibacterium sp.]